MSAYPKPQPGVPKPKKKPGPAKGSEGSRLGVQNEKTEAIRKKVAEFLKEADVNTVDPAVIMQLAMTGAPAHLLASYLNISADTFTNHFTEVFQKGRQQGQLKAFQTLAELAFVKKNLGALIWWGKQNLGWTEKIESKEEQKVVQEIVFTTSLD